GRVRRRVAQRLGRGEARPREVLAGDPARRGSGPGLDARDVEAREHPEVVEDGRELPRERRFLVGPEVEPRELGELPCRLLGRPVRRGALRPFPGAGHGGAGFYGASVPAASPLSGAGDLLSVDRDAPSRGPRRTERAGGSPWSSSRLDRDRP